jgi:hypothetical protein
MLLLHARMIRRAGPRLPALSSHTCDRLPGMLTSAPNVGQAPRKTLAASLIPRTLSVRSIEVNRLRFRRAATGLDLIHYGVGDPG